MKIDQVKEIFTTPLHGTSYPKGPYHYINREFLIVKYETDMEIIKSIVPEPLEVVEPTATFEIIVMPVSTGFSAYIEAAQSVPVTIDGKPGMFTVNMYLNQEAPITKGREIWGFPKKFGKPELRIDRDQVIGTLNYIGIDVATATVAYRTEKLNTEEVKEKLSSNYIYNLKAMPSVTGSSHDVLQITRFQLANINVKWAWKGEATLDLRPCIQAPMYKLPVKRVIEGYHYLTDMTLDYGEVVYDYLQD